MTDLKCQRSGCTGSIEDDYCNLCGHAAGKGIVLSAPLPSATTASVTALSVPMPVSRVSTASRRTYGSRPSGSTTSRGRVLGDGLVTINELPSADPEKLILDKAVVPENKRFCSKCNATLSRETGFCNKCGQKFSFIAALAPGDLVAGQYEVRGAIAYGGLGWIYLGFDRVLSRYVVLKGLMNTADQASAAVAVAEKQFLAAVKHPNIVGIYNFVNHEDTGLIIMEYVGGQTLKELRKNRGSLPVPEAIAYIHRILGAFGYLHQQGLVYCDFKPDNIMLEGSDVKLIDMGGVRRIEDRDGDIYGTVGYSAPEAGAGPTVTTDLFTIARTLAILVTTIPDFGSNNRYILPGDLPVFIKYESLYRWLMKATAEHPDDRFQTAEEMAFQLLGVLHEAVAIDTNKAQPFKSQLFGGDLMANTDSGELLARVLPNHQQLPLHQMLPTDPAFQDLMNASSDIRGDVHQQYKAGKELVKKYPRSIEAKLRLAKTEADLGYIDFKETDQHLQEIEQVDPWDWRVPWYRGRTALAHKNYQLAIDCFNFVYADLPGEVAPKLALAMAMELHGDYPVANRLYQRVCQIDPSHHTAVFGLARCLYANQKRSEAVQALNLIPQTASLFPKARVEAVNLMIGQDYGAPSLNDLQAAREALPGMPISELERYQLSEQILHRALEVKQAGAILPAGHPLPPWLHEEKSTRQELEAVLRSMARLSNGEERVALVDRANHLRPRTWL
jgi:serine/threonine-protein kinase PknG